MPSIFNFVTKEGKHFAPIVTEVPTYAIITDGSTQTGDVVQDGYIVRSNGTTEKSGVKGVFARVRFTNNSDSKAELFAVNSEVFNSSN